MKKETMNNTAAIVWTMNPERPYTDKQLDNRARKLEAIKAEIKALEKEREAVEAEIVAGMMGAEKYETGAFRFFFKTVKSSRFDTKAFKTVYPDTYDLYCKETSAQRFTFAAI